VGVTAPAQPSKPEADPKNLLQNTLYVFDIGAFVSGTARVAGGARECRRRGVGRVGLESHLWIAAVVHGVPPSPRYSHSACYVDTMHVLVVSPPA
jgi:hypothetical protein